MINDFFNILLPQACLVFFILLQLLLSLILSPRYFRYARLLSCIGIFSATLLLSTVQIEPQYFGLHNAYMSDSYTLLFHFVILLCAFLSVLLTRNLIQDNKQNAYTFHAIFLTATLSAMNIVSANDFLFLFVSTEMLSFSLYFLIALKKGYYSKESAFKYLITNAVASGIFLFGVSYLYGITGSINLSEIYEYSANQEQLSLLYSFASIMTLFGLFSKLAIFPFANWILDVYKGCESSILAFLSTIPKLAFFGIICRLLVFAFEGSFEITFVIILISIITALWANIYAIKEKNIKVILACSSAANAAYVMFAAAFISVRSLSSVIFYLIFYVVMNIAVFGFLNVLESNNIDMNINSLKELFQRNKNLTIAYTIGIIGLAGLPITSGFISKIYLFYAIFETVISKSEWLFLPFVVCILLLVIIALFYYLKLIAPLYKDVDDGNIMKLKAFYTQKLVIYACIAVTLLIGIYPDKIIELCKIIAYNI